MKYAGKVSTFLILSFIFTFAGCDVVKEKVEETLEGFNLSKIDTNLPGVTSSSVALGDLNGDNHLDIAVTGENNNQDIANLYLNDGNTSFAQTNAGLSGISDGSVALGDLNGDNHIDIVTAGQGESTVYLNDGEANFSEANANIVGTSSGSIALGDLNGDNHLDIVLTGEDTNGQDIAVLYLNNDNGSFEQADAGLNGISDGSVALGDLNGDNHIDIVTTGQGESTVYLNDGEANFSGAGANLTGVSNGSVALGDLNGDNHLDIVLTGEDTNGQDIAALYLNNDNSSFEQADAGLNGISNGSVALGDLNGDNHIDIVTAGQGESTVYLNEEEANFSEAETDLTGVSNGSVALGDLNGDNLIDIAVTGSNKTAIYMNESNEALK